MTDAQFLLRAPMPADTPAIASLLAELGHPTPPADIPSLLAALIHEGGTVVLAEANDGAPLGLLALARPTPVPAPGAVGYITALVVAAAARGRGVGRALVAAARQWAMQNGCARLTVNSAEHRADAHAFYPACGMPYTGRRFSVPLVAPVP